MIDSNIKQKENVVSRPKEDLNEQNTLENMRKDKVGRITAEDAIIALVLELFADATNLYQYNNRIPGIMEVLSERFDGYQDNLFYHLYIDLLIPRLVHHALYFGDLIGDKINKSGIIDKIISQIRTKFGYNEQNTEYRKSFRYHKLVPSIQPEMLADFNDVSLPEKKIIFRKSPQKIYVKKTLHNKRNLFVNKK